METSHHVQQMAGRTWWQSLLPVGEREVTLVLSLKCFIYFEHQMISLPTS